MSTELIDTKNTTEETWFENEFTPILLDIEALATKKLENYEGTKSDYDFKFNEMCNKLKQDDLNIRKLVNLSFNELVSRCNYIINTSDNNSFILISELFIIERSKNKYEAVRNLARWLK